MIIYNLQWSYGVTCWEVFLLGRVPYPKVGNLNVIITLKAGKRLDKPSQLFVQISCEFYHASTSHAYIQFQLLQFLNNFILKYKVCIMFFVIHSITVKAAPFYVVKSLITTIQVNLSCLIITA